ncbi:CNNM domain-containing protein [Sphingopyxis sp.]|uniref:CNNM domain-containing protein n=1 Tax=Sphingopyxis sp. TaxID=1908224 RepID=UPI003D1433F2
MEHISTTTLIITLIVMVIISAYFSGSETGMMTLNRYRLRHMAKQGNRPAKARGEAAAQAGPPD